MSTAVTKPRRQRRALPKERWTAVLRGLVAIASTGSYDLREKRVELRPATRKNLTQVLGFFLGYLDRTHSGAVELPLARNLTRERLEEFRDDLASTNAPRSVLTLMDRLKMLLARAEYPDAAKLVAAVTGSSQGRAYVPPPRASAGRVYLAGKALFLQRVGEIGGLGLHWRQRARARRAASEALTALLIMFLAQLPLRIKNALGLEVGKQIRLRDDAIVLQIPGEEMKTGRDVDKILGRELSGCIRTYLLEVRPLLVKPQSPETLFLGAKGGPLAYPTAYSRLRRMTQDLVQEPINPHAFRRLMAIWARNDKRLGLDVAFRQNQHVDAKQTDRTYAPARVETGRSVYRASLRRAAKPS